MWRILLDLVGIYCNFSEYLKQEYINVGNRCHIGTAFATLGETQLQESMSTNNVFSSVINPALPDSNNNCR